MSQNNPLTALLEKQPFVVLDGAMATELEARGCNLADSLWSAKVLMENPELIREVHLDYYRAGAQVAITASYQATPAGFAARGLDEAQSRALIGRSVELARKAREAYLAETRMRARCWWRDPLGRMVPIWRMAQSIAVTTCAALRSLLPSTARAWKRCWTRALTCWPAKRCRLLPRLRRWRPFWPGIPAPGRGSPLPCGTAST